jgi:diacylglycerol kinase (ATP)
LTSALPESKPAPSGERAASDLFVVFNPRSGKGRGEQLIGPVLAALRSTGLQVEHALTQAAGDEGRLTEEALGRGFRRVVAVGGDGTWSNVANAILRSGKGASLGVIPAGTGCDLAKSLGIPPRDLSRCAAILQAGHTRLIDVGRIEDRYFLNVAGFGFDIAVIEDSWTVTYLGGDLLYLYCALRQLYRFPGFPVEVSVDGGELRRQDLLMLILANGRIFGGGFKIAPTADFGDGLLEGVAFGNMPLHRRLAIMVQLLRGTHGTSRDGTSRDVTTSRARSYRLRFPQPPAYETDGEWNRARSAELQIDCLPQALSVIVPAS